MRILFAIMATGALILLSAFAARATTADNECHLVSSGMYQNQWVKHRIILHEDVVYGANDMDSVRSELHSLRERGLCR